VQPVNDPLVHYVREFGAALRLCASRESGARVLTKIPNKGAWGAPLWPALTLLTAAIAASKPDASKELRLLVLPR